MADTNVTTTQPGDSSIRLLRPERPTYEVLAPVRDTYVRETLLRGVPEAVPRFIGYLLLDSSPPVIPVLRGKGHDAIRPLRGEFVNVVGTLMGTFYTAFWNCPLEAWVDAEVLSVKDGQGESKVLKVAVTS